MTVPISQFTRAPHTFAVGTRTQITATSLQLDVCTYVCSRRQCASPQLSFGSERRGGGNANGGDSNRDIKLPRSITKILFGDRHLIDVVHRNLVLALTLEIPKHSRETVVIGQSIFLRPPAVSFDRTSATVVLDPAKLSHTSDGEC